MEVGATTNAIRFILAELGSSDGSKIGRHSSDRPEEASNPFFWLSSRCLSYEDLAASTLTSIRLVKKVLLLFLPPCTHRQPGRVGDETSTRREMQQRNRKWTLETKSKIISKDSSTPDDGESHPGHHPTNR
jgi:hypothetical protein